MVDGINCRPYHGSERASELASQLSCGGIGCVARQELSDGIRIQVVADGADLTELTL